MANAAAIPYTTNTISSGSSIATGTEDFEVDLQPGLYEISYSATVTAPNTNAITVTAEADSTDIPDSTSTIATPTAATNYILQKSFIYQATNTPTVIQLVNDSTDAQTFDNVSLVVKRLS